MQMHLCTWNPTVIITTTSLYKNDTQKTFLSQFLNQQAMNFAAPQNENDHKEEKHTKIS